MKNWLKTHSQSVEDPRKAWIELDYCVAVAREDPAEARRVFATVKERTPPSSPVWPRIKQLEKLSSEVGQARHRSQAGVGASASVSFV